MRERRERIQAPSLRWLMPAAHPHKRSVTRLEFRRAQFYCTSLHEKPVLGSRLYRYNKYNALPKISEKRIPEKSIFSQHVPGGTLDWLNGIGALSETMGRKSCRAFFCPLDRSPEIPTLFPLSIQPSFNHPSFSHVTARVTDLADRWGAFRGSCLGSQVGVGRRCGHFLWYLCVSR